MIKVYLYTNNSNITDFIFLNDQLFQLTDDYLESDINIIDVTKRDNHNFKVLGELISLRKNPFILNESNAELSLFNLSAEYEFEYFIRVEDLIDSVIYFCGKNHVFFNFEDDLLANSTDERVFFIEDCDLFVYDELDDRPYGHFRLGFAKGLNKKIIKKSEYRNDIK